jgi:hypothetical protein
MRKRWLVLSDNLLPPSCGPPLPLALGAWPRSSWRHQQQRRCRRLDRCDEINSSLCARANVGTTRGYSPATLYPRLHERWMGRLSPRVLVRAVFVCRTPATGAHAWAGVRVLVARPWRTRSSRRWCGCFRSFGLSRAEAGGARTALPRRNRCARYNLERGALRIGRESGAMGCDFFRFWIVLPRARVGPADKSGVAIFLKKNSGDPATRPTLSTVGFGSVHRLLDLSVLLLSGTSGPTRMN